MSSMDSSLGGSPGYSMSDTAPEPGQRPPSELLSNDEDMDDLVPYAGERQQFGSMTPSEKWESSAYGDEGEGDAFSGDEEGGIKGSQSGDEMLPIIDRDNKYRGPESTWRNWTRHERQEAGAMETARARDLAIHLFNSHALKRRAARFQATDEQEEPEDLRGMAEAASASSFAPPNRWVAWPVPASEVPRTGSVVFDDELSFRMPPDNRPSAELEDCLMAEMLRAAKERFEQRGQRLRRVKSSKRMKRETSRASGIDQTTEDEEDRKSDVDMDAEAEFRPVVSADDEASKKLLLPAARHTLSQLDSLLLSLHYAREAYAMTGGRSGGDSVTETEAESVVATKSSPRKRRMKSSRRAQSRGRKRARSSPTMRVPLRYSESGSEYEESDKSSSRSSSLEPQEKVVQRRRSASGTDRKERLGLRDWSDVIGIASMTGWSQQVVMRTAQRCAQLFGEDMLFRTLDGEGMRQEKSASRGPSPARGSSEESGSESKAIPRKGNARAAHRGNVFCPIEGCARQKNGFSRTWNLNLHLKRVHSSSTTLVGRF
ncbi:hypothetical protein FQN54_005988 [Arachnomyces sp. PD_36]|nr:hypothetical protein FQN54_005988 [Arachnomyces sp. PD_36]